MLSKTNTICLRCGRLESNITLCRRCDHHLPLALTHEPGLDGLRDNLRAFNYPESTNASNSIQSNIDLAKSDLTQYRRLMKQLQSAMSAIEGYINHQASLLAPIRKLPSEILSNILRLACEGQDNWLDFGFVDVPALAISHVCHKWRTIVLDTPLAWSSIGLLESERHATRNGTCYSYTNKFEVSQGIFDLLGLYLDRSRSSPLNISMLCWDPDVIIELCQHSRRWKSLAIDPKALALLTRVKGRTFEHLESLTFGELGTRIGTAAGLDVFHDAPLLRSLTIPAVLFNDSRMKLPWQTLQYLTLICAKASDLHRLADLTRIKKLRIDFMIDDTNPTATSMLADANFELLKTFETWKLQKRVVYGSTSFLRFLKAPVLSRVSLVGSETPIDRPSISSAPFDSIKRLTDLELGRITVSTIQLLSILEVLPSIQRLKLWNLTSRVWLGNKEHVSPITLDLFRAFLFDKEEEFGLLPRLHALEVTDSFNKCTNSQTQQNSLLTMIYERCVDAFDEFNLLSQTVSPIYQLKITFDDTDDGIERVCGRSQLMSSLKDLSSMSSTLFEVTVIGQT